MTSIDSTPSYYFNDVPGERGFAESEFIRLVVDRRLAHTQMGGWASSAGADKADLDGAIFDERAPHFRALCADVEGALVYLEVQEANKWVRVRVGASARESVEERIRELQSKLPPLESSESLVPVSFWARTPHGYRTVRRELTVPTWESVGDNYTALTRTQLATLMNSFAPGVGGQLVLWHGEPGTGKTFALRSLIWEWREWADAHYITDPERFFGEADYMLEVMLEAAPVADSSRRWQLLVLEDTGELLAPDARERTGQGLSRLLNMVDGLIGQGLRVLVLVTTNEELGRLHPAVTRPGRCAMNIEFKALSGAEVEHWARRHGLDDVDRSSEKVAELYARLGNFSNRFAPAKVGF